jgi:hypothetical protein
MGFDVFGDARERRGRQSGAHLGRLRRIAGEEVDRERHPEALAIEQTVRRGGAVLRCERPGDVFDLDVAELAAWGDARAIRIEAHLLGRDAYE